MGTGSTMRRRSGRDGAQRRKAWLVPVVFALGVLSSCIDFDSQFITYTHDPTTDRFLVYKDYHGIHGEDDGERLSKNEEHQLLSTWIEQRIFLFENIPLLGIDEMRQELAQAPSQDADEYDRAERKFVSALVANTHISNGPFYYDDTGRISGVQRMTFYNVTELIALANDAFREDYAREARETKNVETRIRLSRVVADAGPFLLLEGNRITIRLSQSEDEYQDDLEDSLLQMIRNSGVRMTFADGITTATIGRIESSEETLPFNQGRDVRAVDRNVERFIRDRFGIAKRFDPVADAKFFFARD